MWYKVDIKLREQQKSVNELVNAMGITKQAYYKVRKKDPESLKIGRVRKIAEFLNCSIYYLIRDINEEFIEDSTDEVLISLLQRELEYKNKQIDDLIKAVSNK